MVDPTVNSEQDSTGREPGSTIKKLEMLNHSARGEIGDDQNGAIHMLKAFANNMVDKGSNIFKHKKSKYSDITSLDVSQIWEDVFLKVDDVVLSIEEI